MPLKQSSLGGVDSEKLLNPIRVEARYLDVQPLPKSLVRALANQERVYVGGKPHRVKSLGISETGQIMGKLEPLEPLELAQPS